MGEPVVLESNPCSNEKLQAEAEVLEALAQRLESSGAYRVLRRLPPARFSSEPLQVNERIGIVLDVETLGLDPMKDEVIELGMVKFAYSNKDEITRVLGEFKAFQQPSIPIPPEITDLTGITDEMVAGQLIDGALVEAFVSHANIVIAHNASFDRRFAERLWPTFEYKPWACSATQIDWKKHGIGGAKLAYILAGFGYFHEAHRAADDCHALAAVLNRILPGTSESVLSQLLLEARKNTHRIWADNSPYDLKDTLKKRGYRWSDGADGAARAWYTDVAAEALEQELAFLRTEIFQREVHIRTRSVSAWERFSSRL